MPPPVKVFTISDRLSEEARRKRRDFLWLIAYRASVIAYLEVVALIATWLAKMGQSHYYLK